MAYFRLLGIEYMISDERPMMDIVVSINVDEMVICCRVRNWMSLEWFVYSLKPTCWSCCPGINDMDTFLGEI